MTLQLLLFEFLYIWGKFDFLFISATPENRQQTWVCSRADKCQQIFPLASFKCFVIYMLINPWCTSYKQVLQLHCIGNHSYFSILSRARVARNSYISRKIRKDGKRKTQNLSFVQKPNSWTYNFVEVSEHYPKSSQTWGFRIQCLHYKPESNHFCWCDDKIPQSVDGLGD